ncbi:hypothetical protein NUU61_001263 [Penicillium alfredii]|uniref:Uncharacterized protein n=1 Tax=Penicillium alfredii TaxID=1506179 RepID=A0A9W9GBN1_9EURO|nr:uncharacterized protein NUU61_001263 [Penicillium alfredii]KAJ5115504.1 hypothetical protein NUU61_001263 [Penicillium alfredii]
MWPWDDFGELSGSEDQVPSGTRLDDSGGLDIDTMSKEAYDNDAVTADINQLQQTIIKVEKETECLRQDLICAAERDKRQEELLEESRKLANNAIKDNKILLFKVATLQKWADDLVDNDAKEKMRLLYQYLDAWVRRHFGQSYSNDMTVCLAPEEDGMGEDDNQPPTIYDIQAEVTRLIFQSTWTRFMIGFEGAFWNHQLRELDTEIQKLCPTHVRHHWRSATSMTGESLSEQSLGEDCHRIVDSIEVQFAQYSTTDKTKRTQQLRRFLWQCFEFKGRLERQEHVYCFWCSQFGMPFRATDMHNSTGRTGSKDTEVVERSLWPRLYKVLPSQQWSLLEKEVVRTMQKIQKPVATEETTPNGED